MENSSTPSTIKKGEWKKDKSVLLPTTLLRNMHRDMHGGVQTEKDRRRNAKFVTPFQNTLANITSFDTYLYFYYFQKIDFQYHGSNRQQLLRKI